MFCWQLEKKSKGILVQLVLFSLQHKCWWLVGQGRGIGIDWARFAEIISIWPNLTKFNQFDQFDQFGRFLNFLLLFFSVRFIIMKLYKVVKGEH